MNTYTLNNTWKPTIGYILVNPKGEGSDDLPMTYRELVDHVLFTDLGPVIEWEYRNSTEGKRQTEEEYYSELWDFAYDCLREIAADNDWRILEVIT
jgi:hypothetical protein